jgi:hypothetical protein
MTVEFADFKLDEFGDLAVENNDFVIITGADAVRQRLQIALRHVSGEWFQDRDAGTDYHGVIFGKSRDLARRAEFRRRILQIPEIREIVTLELQLDPVTRALSGEIEVILSSGESLGIEVPA